MILCPPEDLFSSVKLETVAVRKEENEGFSALLFRVLAVPIFIFWCFVVFLKYEDLVLEFISFVLIFRMYLKNKKSGLLKECTIEYVDKTNGVFSRVVPPEKTGISATEIDF